MIVEFPTFGAAGEGGSVCCDGVAVAAHAVAVAGDREDGGVVQESVKAGGRDGGVFEDVAQSAMPRLVVRTMERVRSGG